MEIPERWSKVIAFISEWYAPLSDSDGLEQADIDEAEHRLGFVLPDALKEWYALAGRREDLTKTQNVLFLPEQLEIVGDNDEALAFYNENQGVVQWCLLRKDLAFSDPPVYLDNGEQYCEISVEEWVLENQSFTEFILQMLHLEAVLSCKYTSWGWTEQDSRQHICQSFVDTGLPLWHWPGDETRFYKAPGVLVMVSEYLEDKEKQEVWIASRNREAHDQAVSLLKVKWEHQPDDTK